MKDYTNLIHHLFIINLQKTDERCQELLNAICKESGNIEINEMKELNIQEIDNK